jgi:hypothetical protein
VNTSTRQRRRAMTPLVAFPLGATPRRLLATIYRESRLAPVSPPRDASVCAASRVSICAEAGALPGGGAQLQDETHARAGGQARARLSH